MMDEIDTMHGGDTLRERDVIGLTMRNLGREERTELTTHQAYTQTSAQHDVVHRDDAMHRNSTDISQRHGACLTYRVHVADSACLLLRTALLVLPVSWVMLVPIRWVMPLPCLVLVMLVYVVSCPMWMHWSWILVARGW